ncbi:MAG TPA: efflux RND transporter periplasmic adaptor subunit [Opitutaceae bacterium]|nr:efflux RND transporter periplasmic adaptor subunit [Opitutaceae bacterium]
MIKRLLLMLAAMTVIVGGTIGYKLFGRHMMNVALAAQKPPPVTVATAEARALEWRPTLHAVGSFNATQGIVVSAQLDGAVTQIAFDPGAAVASGQLLVQQDVSTETAQLESAEAAATLANLALERAKQLRTSGSNSPSDFDAAMAGFQQARAAVAAIRSTIEKKTIRAPFAGRAGIRLVNLGQFLRSGAAIVSLQALDPIFFNFTLPQQDAPQVACGRQVSVAVDAFPGAVFCGSITAANANVDEATRALQLQATLANRDGRLQPGMFGSVDVELPAAENVVTVPLAAIVYNPYGNAVYVVEPGEGGATIARQQFVQTGATRGDQVAILKGVKAGAVIVTAGQLKLRNGASIVINNSIVPGDSAAPKPDRP